MFVFLLPKNLRKAVKLATSLVTIICDRGGYVYALRMRKVDAARVHVRYVLFSRGTVAAVIEGDCFIEGGEQHFAVDVYMHNDDINADILQRNISTIFLRNAPFVQVGDYQKVSHDMLLNLKKSF